MASLNISSRIAKRSGKICSYSRPLNSSRLNKRLFIQLVKRCQSTSPERQTQSDSEVEVPDSPPAKDSSGTITSRIIEEKEQTKQELTIEDIQKRAAELRALKAESKSSDESLISGVLEEITLISWPNFGSALVNTFIVVGVVAFTSVVIFGVNTGLTEVSKVIYSK